MKLPGQLVRNAYLREHDRGTAGDPNSSTFDPAGPTRTDPAAFEQLAVDLEQYHRTLESLHGIAAHGAGIGYGLQVSAVLDQPDVQIAPGIAIDGQGRHIHLAQGLKAAETSPRADDPLAPLRPANVTAAGVKLPTASLAGDFLVTIQKWETFDENTSAGSDGRNQQFRHTPWLRLIKPGQYDPEKQVVLAKVTLDSGSKVKALTPGDGNAARREGTSLPAQRIRLKRGAALDGLSVDTVPSGEVRARDGGGLQLSVASTADQIEFVQGESGHFAQMVVSAKDVKFGSATDPSLVVNTSDASLVVGGSGSAGQVVLRDQQGKPALRLDGARGAAAVSQLEPIGDNIRVTSDLVVDGVLRAKQDGDHLNVKASALRIEGSDLILQGRTQNGLARALVDAGGVLSINHQGDYANGVTVESDLRVKDALSTGGDLVVGGELHAKQDTDHLHVRAGALWIHGSDLMLQGRTQNGFARALVDLGDGLCINFQGDYANGVTVASDLAVQGALSTGGDLVVGGALSTRGDHVVEGALSTRGDLVVDGALRAKQDDTHLHVKAAALWIHGSDLMLQGRTQNGFARALVDLGDELCINFQGDYTKGVTVHSNLSVGGDLLVGGAPIGSPTRKVVTRWLFSGRDQQTLADIDLGVSRQFTAFCIPMVSSRANNDNSPWAVAADITAVDGTPTPTFVFGEPFWGPNGDARNVRTPCVSQTGRLITFRLRGLGPRHWSAAVAIVFYE